MTDTEFTNLLRINPLFKHYQKGSQKGDSEIVMMGLGDGKILVSIDKVGPRFIPYFSKEKEFPIYLHFNEGHIYSMLRYFEKAKVWSRVHPESLHYFENGFRFVIVCMAEDTFLFLLSRDQKELWDKNVDSLGGLAGFNLKRKNIDDLVTKLEEYVSLKTYEMTPEENPSTQAKKFN